MNGLATVALLVLTSSVQSFASEHHQARYALDVHSRFLDKIVRAEVPYAHVEAEAKGFVGFLQTPGQHYGHNATRVPLDIQARRLHARQRDIMAHEISFGQALGHKRADIYGRIKHKLESTYKEFPPHEEQGLRRLLGSKKTDKSEDSTGHTLRGRKLQDACEAAVEQLTWTINPAEICVYGSGKSTDLRYGYDNAFCKGPSTDFGCEPIDPCTECPNFCSGFEKQCADKLGNCFLAKLDAGDLAENHPCKTVDACPPVKGEEDRNGRCENAVREYCSEEDTDCTSAGCSSALQMRGHSEELKFLQQIADGTVGIDKDNEDDWREEHVRIAGREAWERDCPFSDKTMCVDSPGYEDPDYPLEEWDRRMGIRSQGSPWCATSHFSCTNHEDCENGNGAIIQNFAYNVREVMTLSRRLNKPCWSGKCFNSFVQDSCVNILKKASRPKVIKDPWDLTDEQWQKKNNGEPLVDISKCGADVANGGAIESSEPVPSHFLGPTCAEGCCNIVDFFVTRFGDLEKLISESGGYGDDPCQSEDAPDLCKIFPSDLPWNLSSVANNRVSVCESKWQLIENNEDGSSGEPQFSGSAHDLYRCLQEKCSGCFGNTPVDEKSSHGDFELLLPDMNTRNPSEEQCAYDVAEYCSSEDGRKDDICKGDTCKTVLGCDEESWCPCSDATFKAYYEKMGMCDRSACLTYRKDLTSVHAKKGYFQPSSPWMERLLRYRNALLYEPGAKPDIVFTLTSDEELQVSESREECLLAGEEAPSIVNLYVEKMILFCNTQNGEHSDACRDFSPCGDGIVSWGEECDGGLLADHDNGGCERCQHIKDGYACASPGMVCDVCDQHSAIRQNSENMDSVCQFCLNEKVEGMPSMCNVPVCKNIDTLEKAKECDDTVEKYCTTLTLQKSSDPGCVNYVKEVRKFSVPRVKNGCTFKFIDFQLFSEGLVSEEVAIIDCEFADETYQESSGEPAPDTTPLFWNIDPTVPVQGDGGLTKEARASLAGVLEALSSARSNTTGGGLLPLTELQLTDFYPFMDPAVSDGGNPIPEVFTNGVARFGELVHKDTSFTHDKNTEVNLGDDPQSTLTRDLQKCNWVKDSNLFQPQWKEDWLINIVPLPPCEDPAGWAATAKAMEYSFKGHHDQNHVNGWNFYGKDEHMSYDLSKKYPDFHQAYRNLVSIDPHRFNTSCTPRKGHFVSMVSVSRTLDSRYCHGEGCAVQDAWREDRPKSVEKFDIMVPIPSGGYFNSNPVCDYKSAQRMELHCCIQWKPGGHCYFHPGDSWCSECKQRMDAADENDCCSTFDSSIQTGAKTLKQSLLDGDMNILFGNRLFQKGCTNHACKFPIEPCSKLPLRPAPIVADLGKFENARAAVEEKIFALQDESVKSWANLTQVFFEISAVAASQGFSEAKRLFNDLVTLGEGTSVLQGVENYCDQERMFFNSTINPLWENDPCCNWDLRRVQCCAPKDVTGATVTTITGINYEAVTTRCKSREESLTALKNVFHAMEMAREAGENLESESGASALQNLWSFKETCMQEIGMEEGSDRTECQSNSDCPCSYQQCDSATSTCNVPWDKLGECFSQCFERQADQKIVNYLKEMWNISQTSSASDFELKFIEHMTEENCIGPDRWQEGIGENRMEWRCNSTCRVENICHRHDIFGAYSDWCHSVPRSNHHICQPWSYRPACEAVADHFNSMNAFDHDVVTTWTPTEDTQNPDHDGSCEISFGGDGVFLPCDCDACEKPCNSPSVCTANGGTWNTENKFCCPAGNYIHEEEHGGETHYSCRHYPVGTPPSHKLRNEVCCVLAGGSWVFQGEHSHNCCLGEWKTEEDSLGRINTFCQDHVDTHRQCEECRDQNCPWKQCQMCEQKREKCCGETKIWANKTACLSYSRCNDRRYDNNNCGGTDTAPDANELSSKVKGYSDQAFCAECWGPDCYSRTSKAKCRITGYAVEDPSSGFNLLGVNEGYCTSINRDWEREWGDHGDYACFDRHHSVKTAEDCFRRNVGDINGGVTLNSGQVAASCDLASTAWDSSNWQYTWARDVLFDGATPPEPDMYQHRHQWCGRLGCYKPKNPSDQCPAQNSESWYLENDICKLQDTSNHFQTCDSLSSDLAYSVLHEVTWDSGEYNSREECENGECLGNLRQSIWNGISWNASQCRELSSGGCNRECPKCVATGKYSDDSWIKWASGACFDSSNNLIEQHPYRNSKENCEDNIDCDSGNCEWHSCEDRSWTNKTHCQSSPVQSTLKCILNEPYKWDENSDHKWIERGTCPDEASCLNTGECHHTWEYSGEEKCFDPNYSGPEGTCHYSYERIVERDVTIGGRVAKQNVTEWYHESCTQCQHSDRGSCIASNGAMGRNPVTGDCAHHWQRHPLGCRVPGYFENRSGCIADGYNFTRRPNTKEECLAVKGCKMPFEGHFSSHTEKSCLECGGSWESRLKWDGGRWVSGEPRPMTWISNGLELKPSNQWLPSMSEDKMEAALRIPVMKLFAERKVTQGLMEFNSFTSIMNMLVCDCGATKGTNCYTRSSASVAAAGRAFCGDEDTVMQGATSKVVIKKECQTGANGRRLADAGSEAASLQFQVVSAGPFTKNRFCDNDKNSFDFSETGQCTGSNTNDLDALVVKNLEGTVIGQIIGDGAGIQVNGASFNSIAQCLPFRSDISRDSIFTQYDVAKYDPDTGNFTSLDFNITSASDCSSANRCTQLTSAKICFQALTEGQYFPIKKIMYSSTISSVKCSGADAVNPAGGVCVAGTTKRCFLGFSGKTCNSGCPNHCSGAGNCASFNTCSCDAKRVGRDCSIIDCPKGSDGNYCSLKGLCQSDATCHCNSGWKGANCGEEIVLDKDIQGGLGESGIPRSRDGIKISSNRGNNQFPGFLIPVIIVSVVCLVIILATTIFCCRKKRVCCFKNKQIAPKADTVPAQVEMEMITNPKLKGTGSPNKYTEPAN